MVRIKDLTALSAAPAVDDEFALEDTSANQTKKITFTNIKSGLIFNPADFVAGGSPSWLIETFTPTLAGMTLGDGTMNWYFFRVGYLVWFWGVITWGTTSVGGGSFTFTLPVATALNDFYQIGNLAITDVSITPDDQYAGTIFYGAGDLGRMMTIQESGGGRIKNVPLTSTFPATAAVGDTITLSGNYRVV